MQWVFINYNNIIMSIIFIGNNLIYFYLFFIIITCKNENINPIYYYIVSKIIYLFNMIFF
jgi:hypothetical protein